MIQNMTTPPNDQDRRWSGPFAYASCGAVFGLVIGLLFGQAAYAVAFAVLGGVIIGLDMWVARIKSAEAPTAAHDKLKKRASLSSPR
jgi:uncharacterized iron-regulated membrane protein